VSDIAALVADNLDIWTGAIERKSGAGRGGGKRISLYGIDRLRALILDLAVRGKLSAKDPATKQGSLGQVGNWAGGNGFPKSFQGKADDDFPFLKVSDMNLPGNERQITVANNYVSAEDLQAMGAKAHPSGTIIFPKIGGAIATNKRRILSNPSAIDNNCAGQIPGKNTDVDWLYMVLSSIDMSKYQAGTSVPALNMKKLAQHPIAIPTVSEQRRIVTKVEELLALCDALERESAGAMAAHQALVEILLATLVNSVDATDLARDWARLERHFDTLFTTDASIDTLKQTVLALAVRGKLVEQDAAEDPADYKAPAKNAQSTPPFAIPQSWQCRPFKSLGRQIGGGTPSKSRMDFWGGPIPWISPKDMKKDYLFEAELSISEAALQYSPVKMINSESLLFVVRGMILAHSFPVAMAKAPVTINQDMKAIELHEPEMGEYVLRALKGLKPLMLARVERSSHGTCRLDSAAYGDFLVPIPPLAEQRRIVAKVDALMALCDALKARLADAAQTQRHLADAITQRAAA
jgi:type I restriction enzyme S subunit